jgi:hypothetical protein
MEREKGEVFEMKNKISAIILIAALSLGMFAVWNFAYGADARIELREPHVVNPDYGTTGYKFDVEVWLMDVVGVAGWETKIYWDPSVLQLFKVTFGPFFGGNTNNYTKGSMGGEYVLVGQLKSDGTTVTGTGNVANLTLIFKYPGATHIWIFESHLLNGNLEEIPHTLGDSTVKTDHPAALFTWWVTEPDGETPASALPDHYLKDDCQTIQVYKIVWFNGSASYDVCNLMWNGTAWVPDQDYPDIKEYMWWFGDGYQSNDLRLYHGVLPRGNVLGVRFGDPDINRPLIAFTADEKHDETVAVNKLYDGTGVGPMPAWEGVYNDTDASGNVTLGDYRYTPASIDWMAHPAYACAYVMPPDIDIGRKLVAFKSNEKHTEGIMSEPGASEVVVQQYINGKYDNWEPIYRDMQHFKDLGWNHVSIGSEIIDHVFPGYNIDGWEVVLRVYDSEHDYWQSNWRYGGSAPENTVPMWRDVAVVDIWPSIPPYDDIDWYDYWFFDTTDYEIPPPSDPFWDSPLRADVIADFGLSPGATARDIGVWILVSAANYGSVHDWGKVSLYAIKTEYEYTKVDYTGSGVTFQWLKRSTPYRSATSVEYLGSQTTKIAKMAGAGWYYIFFWMPKTPAFYQFFATIDIVDAVSQDQNLNNNYVLLGTIVQACDTIILGQATANYARFICDVNGNGKVGDLRDYYIIMRNWGLTWTPPVQP